MPESAEAAVKLVIYNSALPTALRFSELPGHRAEYDVVEIRDKILELKKVSAACTSFP
jgi:hypothetical protein